MEGIIRTPTETDKQFFDINLDKDRALTVHEKFQLQLNKEEAKATKLSLPFARHVARDEFEGALKEGIQAQLRKYGEVRDNIELPKTDWNRYSDLKNFDLIETTERSDDQVSKRNPGLDIKFKVTTYKFKGYFQTYKIMETESSAVERAQNKIAKNRK